MKRLIISGLVFMLAQAAWGQWNPWPINNCERKLVSEWEIPACNTDPYVLIFEDNFDGTELDFNLWRSVCTGGGGAMLGNPGESATLELNRLENCEVSNGTLKITARNENVIGMVDESHPADLDLSDGLPNERPFQYTSAKIKTIEQYGYGKYEARCKLPTTPGVWPAFWGYAENPRWHEIDFFEVYDEDMDTWTGSLHHDYNEDGEKNASDGESCTESAGPYDFGEWHTFTCYYEPDYVKWEIDGQQVGIKYRYTHLDPWLFVDIPVTCATQVSWPVLRELKAYVDEPMAIIFNMSVTNCGFWEDCRGNAAPFNGIEPGAVFPAVFEIDYVRYWGKSCQNCQDDMSYTNTQTIPQNTHTNVSVIGAAGATVLNNQNVEFLAGDQVGLLPGFEVEEGAAFRAEIEECNNNQSHLYPYWEFDEYNFCNIVNPGSPIVYIGSNLVNGHDLFLCSDPVLRLEAYGVNNYSVRVKTYPGGSLVHAFNGLAASNHIQLWNAINVTPGTYTVELQLRNCDFLDERSFQVVVSQGNCKMAGTSGETGARPLLPEVVGSTILYPNPSSGKVHIQSSSFEPGESIALEVFDLSGRMVLSTRLKYENGVGVDLKGEARPAGVYLVKISGSNQPFYQKIILE